MFQELLNLSSVRLSELIPINSQKTARPRSFGFSSSTDSVGDISVEELIAERQRIRDYLQPLITKSKELAEQSENQANECAEQSKEAISARAALYDEINDSTGRKNELTASIRKLEAEQKALMDEERGLYQEVDSRRRHYEEARKKAEKWCWVPGYNIYLYVEAKEDYEGLIKKIEDLRKKQEHSRNSIAELNAQIGRLGQNVSAVDRKINDIEKKIALYVRKISYFNAMTCQFNEFAHQYQYLYECVGSADDMAFILKAVAESNEIIEKLTQQENEIRKKFEEDMRKIGQDALFCIASLTYRGNVLYKGQKLRCGEYLASLNKRFIAAVSNDGSFVVRNSDKELAVVSDNVTEVVFDNDGVVRFGAEKTAYGNAEILIMQDDGNLVTYDPAYKPLWATDTWQYGAIDSKPFDISLPSYGGKYIISSYNSMCFDITDRSLDNCARLQLYYNSNVDNQKFFFEQTKTGAYRITAAHSGKCLEVSDGSLSDGASIIQYDYHGGKNQLFWVLPCREEGYVKLIAVHSSKAVDVTAGNFSNFALIQQYFENGSKAQMFRLVKC